MGEGNWVLLGVKIFHAWAGNEIESFLWIHFLWIQVGALC